MPYVLVPVPEEHVVEVMSYVIRLVNRASIQEWDETAVAEFFRESDEASRSLLSIVARGVLAGKELTDQQAADFIQLSARETLGVARELNDKAKEEHRPQPILVVPVTEELPNGRTREKRALAMPGYLAPMVRDAERELELAQPSPLEVEPGSVSAELR
jgi:hypothetical protein